MAYKFDIDLEFLRELKNEELNDLVSIITHDKDGSARWTELLSVSELYKTHYPNHQKYLNLILEEIQKFGGNSLANVFRGSGILYKEILCDVADKYKVNYNRKADTELIETNLFMKILETSLDKMSQEDIKTISQELDLRLTNFDKQALMASLQILIKQSLIIPFVINRTILMGIGCIPPIITGGSILAGTALGRVVTIFTGPIGWAITGAWTAIDLAGPAYRVTMPLVIQIAFLRQLYKAKPKGININSIVGGFEKIKNNEK
ncbi:DUF3944 domain-containing protein [Campylobacter sp. CCS1377]|uniref:DUF3944 domain-containing protein n=1 Tax=Campylobacter sp. CCS1377 TaxID=3158229 RepID=A0AAU7E5D0_9BACT|nr:DUF3944 domain-containing protein [Campylobacter jejuni]